MSFSLEGVLDTLKKGLAYAQSLTPVATAIGGPIVGKVFDVVTSTIDIATDLKTSIDTEKLILSEDDQAALDKLIADLSAEADRLADLVDKS